MIETQEQFDKLKDFVRESQFDRLGVFTYSPEEGTPAALMPNQISEEVKKRRMDEIMCIQQTISKNKNRRVIGKG